MKLKYSENKARIEWAIKNKVLHFAPTIAPAPKNVERNEIESIYNALLIYKEHGIKRVIIEPKYMGSYCDILVTEDINNSQFFTKKGYIIDYIDRDILIKALKPIHDRISYFFDWSIISEILIQSELTPWSILGKGLIEREFTAYHDINKIHYDYLKKSDVMSDIHNLKHSSEILQYVIDKNNGELSTYNQHLIKQYEAIININIPNIDILSNSVSKYQEQIDIYGYGATEAVIKPFNILKTFYKDGSEFVNNSNVYGFEILSTDDYIVLDLDNFEESIEIAYKYFNSLVDDNQMEGVVIKPDDVYIENVAPMYKVRNNNYLTLIYGVDFDVNYNEYLSKRKVGKKVKVSTNEWKIAQSLLKIKKEDISADNELYVDLVEKRIFEEKLEDTLDSRL